MEEEQNHQPAAEVQPPELQEQKPSALSRFFGFVFNKESKLGRFNRTLVRGIAIFIGVFAIGFLVAYFTLYQPATQKLQESQDQVSSYQQELVTLRRDFTTLQENDAKLQNNYVTLADVLKRQQAHTQLVSALADVQLARLSLAGNNPALAKAALKDTASKLNIVSAYLKSLGTTDGELIIDRFELAIKVIDSSDITQAGKDLLIIADALLDLEKKYFPM